MNNATAYTSSQKLLNESALHAVISLLWQSRKFWRYLLLTSSMLLHNVIMTSYCCQRHAECLVTTLCSRSAPAHHAAHMQQYCCVKKRQTRPTCGLQTVQIPVLLITRSGYRAARIYHRQIHSVDELKRRLIDVWCGLNSRFLTRPLTSGEEDIKRVSMLC